MVEWFALSAERANHDRAGCGERLLGGPECVFAFARTGDDQTIERQPIVCEADRIRRALFGKRGVLASPEDAGWPSPFRGQRQGEPQRRRLGPRPGRPNLVQRLTSHGGKFHFKAPARLWGEGWGPV